MDLALLRRLNLNHLATFLAIAESGSFRRAATRLNISQSALSVHIRHLEDTLEVKLLDRTTRSVVLTPAGNRLLPVAQMLAAELTGTAKLLTEEARLQKRILRVATVPFLIRFCAPALMNEFCNLHPGVEIRLIVREASKLVAELVRQAEADIGMTYWNPELDQDDFSAIFHEDLVAVVPASEARLANRESISLRELSTFPFLIQPKGTFMRDVLDAHMERLNIKMTFVHSVLHADAMIALVTAGVGVGLQPTGVLSLFNLNGCRVIPVKEIPPRPVGLVLPPRNRTSSASTALRDFILHACRK